MTINFKIFRRFEIFIKNLFGRQVHNMSLIWTYHTNTISFPGFVIGIFTSSFHFFQDSPILIRGNIQLFYHLRKMTKFFLLLKIIREKKREKKRADRRQPKEQAHLAKQRETKQFCCCDCAGTGRSCFQAQSCVNKTWISVEPTEKKSRRNR